MRYFLRLSYKGTNFSGWQIQENAITIQSVLNDGLAKLLSQETETTGCGRTDTGVHASQFYLHFDTSDEISDTKKFLYSLNAILPNDIAVYDIIHVERDSHARFDAILRSYSYFISSIKNPFIDEFVWYNHHELNINEMNIACSILCKHSDFKAFSKSNTQVKTFNCSIKNAHWYRNDNYTVFKISADRFLRGMVRAIVGTMIEIGTGKLKAEDLTEIINSKDRSNAGTSVPPHALFLTEVRYPFLPVVEEFKFPIGL